MRSIGLDYTASPAINFTVSEWALFNVSRSVTDLEGIER